MKTWAPRRERVLFVHIPKTAGMTIRAELSSQYYFQDKAPAERWGELRAVQGPLNRYKLFVGHFRYFFRRLLPADTKVFTFLRDPVDRTISHLKHLATDPEFHELHELARGRDLRDVAQDPRIMAYCSNVMVGYLSGARPDVTDADLLRFPREDDCCEAPDRIDDAIAALMAMDFVGFVDDIDNDFARLAERLGLHPPRELPRINTAAERPEVSSEGAELREILTRANALDCAFYAAAKELFADRAPPPSRADRIAALVRDGVCGVLDSTTEFSMSGPIPGTGFWSQEREARELYRWTGPEKDLILELPLRPDMAFALAMTTRLRLDVGDLSAFVDGVPVDLQKTHLGGFGYLLRLDIPLGRPSPVTTVRIAVERVVRPSEFDPRLLGFVMVKLIVTAKVG